MFTLLYVDDEPALLEIGKMFLEMSGQFSVATLTSASEALRILSSEHYDGIISDYQMPGINGIEFLKQVRASGSTVPFIIFTGRGREEIVIQALNEGADFYLQKGGEPVSQFAELEHKIQHAILQRMAQESVRDHERREADIINFLPDATLAIDTKGVVIAWNRAMERMTGVKAEQILGKGNYEYALPFYHERRPLLIDNVLMNDPAVSTHYPNIKREGKTLFSETTIPHFNDGRGAALWFTASPLYDTRGNVIGAIESIREISERKKVEDAIRESEQKYRTVFETTGTATVLIEDDATISLANSEFERLSGYTKEEIENKKKWIEFVVPEDLERMLTQHRQRRLDRQSALKHYEFSFVTRSGDVREIYITIDVVPGTSKSVASLLDITKRKRAERLLVTTNEEYINLLDQIQDIYYRSDAGGHLIKASRSWAVVLGYDNVSECLGRSIADDFYVNPANRQEFLDKVYRDGKVTNYEVLLKRKDNTPVLVATNSHLYRDPAGNVLGIEGTFSDITERKQQEQILRSQLDLGLALLATHDLKETMGICLRSAIGISGMDSGGIYLVDKESGSVDLYLSENLGEDFVRLVSHYPAGSPNGQIVMAGKPFYSPYTRNGLARTPVHEREGLRAGAIIPIMFENRVTACLNIASHTVDGIPAISRLALETIATRIGSAIERIRADEELAQSEQKYRNIVEDQTEFISRFTPDGTHVFVNEAYCRYFGMSREEILGHRFSPDIPAQDKESVKKFFKSLTPDHPVDTIVHRIILPDGRVRWQRWSDRAIFDLSGRVTEYQSVGRDITEIKDAELTLQAAYEQLTASDEELRGQYEELARSEQSIRESEAKFRAIIDQSFQFIGLLTPDGILLEANRTALEFAGTPESAVINRPFWEIPWGSHSVELQAQLKDAIQRAASGETVRFDATHVAANGEPVNVDLLVKPVKNATGQIIYLITEGRDVTKLKNIEATLIKRTVDLDSRNRLISTLLDTVPIGIFMVEAPSRKPIIANRQAARLLGRGILPDATKKNLAEVYEVYRAGTSDRYPAEEMPIIRGMHGESSHIDDMVVVRPDGTRARLEIFGNPVTDSKERIVASLVSFLDITERMRTEEALRIAKEKYAKAFLAGPDAITISELDSGKFVEVNDAATALFGYSREELIGKSATELGIWQIDSDRDAFIDQLEKQGRVHEYEARERRKSGEMYDALVNAVTLTIGGRNFFIAIVRDITEWKRAERTIAEINKKINLLTRITRHDVANQIAILRGFASIAMEKARDPVVLGLLEKIDRSVSTISQQIEFTKAYQELGMHAPGWHRIRDIIAQQKTDGISLSCTCNAEIFADPMLGKVFFNLIDNASRHGERVTAMTISCRPGPGNLVITVEDNGIGIPPGLKEKIFLEGYGQHTGFGLFFARVVLEITGISIHETGTFGNGARFEITVPEEGYRIIP
ncbi:PAS domain S-box protein [uncultured Methanoregula sp.]|uniref:PAS domain S-box protein n=1 Tax=uncultured Methanoregula sp. TaxID=1005933 RepID=UPI002AAA7E77|nr:PAS domain S-box protein [uncultured Methanoregula sp.]